MSAFQGFPAEAWEFFDRLAADNTAAFFKRHRATYRSSIVAPSVALVDELVPRLGLVHPALRGEAKIGRSLFRINRDTRFSADKTPYKTHIDFLFWTGDGADEPRAQAACIARLTSTTVLTGAGRIGLRGQVLADYRSRVTDPVDGPRIRAMVDELLAAGSTLSGPVRAGAPRHYRADPSQSELLRRDGFHVSRTEPHPEVIASHGLLDWLLDRFRPYAGLIELLR